MTQLSDIEIAQQASWQPIWQIAEKLNIARDALMLYGDDKAKITIEKLEHVKAVQEGRAKPGKLILVTAITPTSAGEGKTTTSVGLVDALASLGKKAAVSLREPSLGPVFGIKGGAAGGGYAQVIPMEDINLHFTGDFHAIGAAHNLLAALLDNHIHHGNQLNIDPRSITWKRVVDMNDRQLRHIVDGLHGRINGSPREDGYDITVASEIMAILCLSSTLFELKEKLGRMVVASTTEGTPVTAHDLKAEGAMTVLLKDAIKPNLVQTLEGTPAFIHGGPFANIAHGCSSILATKLAQSYADYAVTEAGFGADLGAEKFVDITCRLSGLQPNAVVLVATVRALKMHGGVAKEDLNTENVPAVQAGLPNLKRHIHTIKDVWGLPVVVALNAFPTDSAAEFEAVYKACAQAGVPVAHSTVWADGGKGAQDLARIVCELAEQPSQMRYSYELTETIEEKLTHVVRRIYGGTNVVFTPAAQKDIAYLKANGFANYPICVAKTQYSFSDNPKLLGAPSNFDVTIRNLRVSAGAGFIVALAGNIMTMPGLPKRPAAEQIDIDEHGKITGLF